MDAVDRILQQWRSVRPDLDVRPMGPIGRLSRVAHEFSRTMAKTFAHHGLNAAGFDLLATLRRSPPPHALSAGELMSSMMITSGTMTNRIDQLVKAGLVKRMTDPSDARRAVVTLTSVGFNVIEEAIADHVQTQERLLANMDIKEVKQLDELLRKLMVPTDTGERRR
jgi:DNA-binding MarR family transcriptional regulator